MLLKILLGVAVLIVVFVIVAALQPAAFRIERSIVIAAPEPQVFARVNDLHQFQEWSPWAKLDPACRTTFEGPTAGAGASFSWNGNNKVGEGKMTIVEDRPPEF